MLCVYPVTLVDGSACINEGDWRWWLIWKKMVMVVLLWSILAWVPMIRGGNWLRMSWWRWWRITIDWMMVWCEPRWWRIVTFNDPSWWWMTSQASRPDSWTRSDRWMTVDLALSDLFFDFFFLFYFDSSSSFSSSSSSSSSSLKVEVIWPCDVCL